jgi:hypothetical protein
MQIQQLPIYRIKYRQLEAFLKKTYRMDDFDLLFAIGQVNGICPEYSVQAVIPPHLMRQAASIRRGHRTKNLNLILNVLCVDNHIPAGKYIIDTHKEPRPIDIYTSLIRRHQNPEHPECRSFKAQHRHERGFREQAAIIDKAVTDFLAQQQPLCSAT